MLYDAGIDPFGGDRLGKLELTEEGLYRRDLFVITECARRGVPVACVMSSAAATTATVPPSPRGTPSCTAPPATPGFGPATTAADRG